MTTTTTRPEGYPETPNLDKMGEVKETSQTVGEFLEWLGEQGWQVAKYGPMTGEIPCPGEGFGGTCEGGTIKPGTHRERTCSECEGTGWVTTTREGWSTYSGGIEVMLGDYFGIDVKAAERERMAVLRWVREESSQ